jgi:hypothetical protein
MKAVRRINYRAQRSGVPLTRAVGSQVARLHPRPPIRQHAGVERRTHDLETLGAPTRSLAETDRR